MKNGIIRLGSYLIPEQCIILEVNGIILKGPHPYVNLGYQKQVWGQARTKIYYLEWGLFPLSLSEEKKVGDNETRPFFSIYHPSQLGKPAQKEGIEEVKE